MTLKPFLSRSKLCADASAAGCIVAHDGSATTIEDGATTLTLGRDAIKDQTGAEMTRKQAFERLGLSVD